MITAVALAACQSSTSESSPRTTAGAPTTTSTEPATTTSTPLVSSTTTTVRPSLAAATMRARRVYPFVEPTAAVERRGDDRVWVTERAGFLSYVDGANAFRVLDLSGEVSTNGERGLLGLAFSLDGSRLYLSFTDRTVANRVVEYEMSEQGPLVKTRRDVITEPHPFNAHHGGSLATGPDGMLYIGWGDGENPAKRKENPQSLESLLGKILRIDPRASGGRPYSIPTGNPFVGRPGARPEVFALGLRNPWRFTFDRRTGDLWIGDVGQYRVEEISLVRAGHAAGANFGWPFLEGVTRRQGTAPAGLTAPLLTYDHDERCAVIGGYVYRGSAIPALRGSYLYGDLCDNHVRALRVEGDRIVEQKDFGALVPEGLAGFGEDAEGELYVLSLPQGLFKLE
jgi:glucose/arabinose dehydrogenase